MLVVELSRRPGFRNIDEAGHAMAEAQILITGMAAETFAGSAERHAALIGPAPATIEILFGARPLQQG
jgi:hypothetical protein